MLSVNQTETGELNEEELLGDDEAAMGDSDGEEIPEEGQDDGLCMDEEEEGMVMDGDEGEMMDGMAEDEDQFPDSNLDDEGHEFAEVGCCYCCCCCCSCWVTQFS